MDVIRSRTSDSLYFWLENQPKGNIVPAYEAHPAYEIYILYSGERYMYLGNALYHIQRGDAVMVAPETPHRSFGNTPYTGICIEFSDLYIRSVFGSAKYDSIAACFSRPVIALDENALNSIHSFTAAAKENKKEENACLSKITDILYEFYLAGSFGDNLSPNSDLSNIGWYIRKNFLTIKGLDELTEHFKLSKSHLCRIFKQHTGVTVTHYINALRIQYAYKLIAETNIPIKDIYIMCGYNNSQYFNRVFKQIRGCTPHTARKEARRTLMWEHGE